MKGPPVGKMSQPATHNPLTRIRSGAHHTSCPLMAKAKANSTLCYMLRDVLHAMRASLAQFHHKHFTTAGGLPVNFGQMPCAYWRMKPAELRATEATV
jgi:hypothetical protein